jgi:hypothetical protein
MPFPNLPFEDKNKEKSKFPCNAVGDQKLHRYTHLYKWKGKGKNHVHIMMAYGGARGKTPPILNF